MAFALLLIALVLPASASALGLQPREGASLTQIHVEFVWEVSCRARGYELQVVEDDGRADPFSRFEPVVETRVQGIEPRAVVTEGLAWGTSYAWRARGLRDNRGRPTKSLWGPTHRFRTKALPQLPAWTVSEPEPGPLQPGLTLVDIIGFRQPPGIARSVAVDRAGDVVWYNEPTGNSADVRQLPDGLFTWIDSGRAFASTLAGDVVWASPDDPDLQVHHEVFPMPNGNFLAVVWDDRTLERDGELEDVRGDRLVEFDRATNDVVWEWSTFDHYSLDDEAPDDVTNGNWTHVNAVVYDEADHSVTISSRSLSRITRIDYETGEIIYNMGKPAVSGDVDFGFDFFKAQHAPEPLPNGNLLLHDNGTCCDPVNDVTRAIEIAFDDPDAPTSAEIVWEWVAPRFSRIIGDADRLPNGNTLVASGAGGTPGVVYEVTDAGALVWELVMEMPWFFYRAERIDQLVVRTPEQEIQALLETAEFAKRCRTFR